MTASTQTVPRQLTFGRFPTAFVALAMVAILAVAVALAIANGSKTTPATGTGAHGYAAPIVHDGGSRETFPGAQNVPAHDTDHGNLFAGSKAGADAFGGWGGPRLSATAGAMKDAAKDDTYTPAAPGSRPGHRTPGLRPQ